MSGLRTMHVLRIVSTSASARAAVPVAVSCASRCAARSFGSTRASRRAEDHDFASPSSSSRPAAPPASSYRSSPSSQHLYSFSPSSQKSYLEGLLAPVAPLPNAHLIDELLAERCLTHKSGVEKSFGRGRPELSASADAKAGGQSGHNEKMSFVGRRILRLYLTLHLNSKLSSSHPSLLAHAVSPRAIDALLNTKQLGATVGGKWKLEDAMRWREVRGPTGEMTGLWKVRGMGVEAIMGGVFTSQGIEAASKVFHQLVLPNLTFPQTLQRALAGAAVEPSESLPSTAETQPRPLATENTA
ncbi:hypothetical protein JCM3766R1_002432 [Sporobolomyces carnicolor]